MRRLAHGPNESGATGVHAGSTGTLPMRTPEEIARLTQIMLGIKGDTIEEAHDYVIMVEIRNEYSRLAEAELEQEKILRTLGGIKGIEDADRWNMIRKTIMLNKGEIK